MRALLVCSNVNSGIRCISTPEPTWRACALPTAFGRTFSWRPFLLVKGAVGDIRLGRWLCLLDGLVWFVRPVWPVWPVRQVWPVRLVRHIPQESNALMFLILYKTHIFRHPILGKNRHEKHANRGNFSLARFFICLIFECFACILHHFASLFGAQFVIFSPPITCFWHLKTHFLTLALPFLAMFLMALKGFIYTVVADIYA